MLPGRPKNSEVHDPSSQFVESKAKKKKFQGTPVEAIPEDSANSPRLIDGCAVFRASFRWVLRLKEWFTQGLDTFQRCTLREPTTIPEPWTERLERLNTRSFTEAQEDLLREELNWLYAVRNQCEEDGIRRNLEAEPEVHPFFPPDYRSYGAVEKLKFNIMTMRTMMGWVPLQLNAPVRLCLPSQRMVYTPPMSGGMPLTIPYGEDQAF